MFQTETSLTGWLAFKGRRAVTALQHDSCAGHVACEPYDRLWKRREGIRPFDHVVGESIHVRMPSRDLKRNPLGSVAREIVERGLRVDLEHRSYSLANRIRGSSPLRYSRTRHAQVIAVVVPGGFRLSTRLS